VDKRASTFCQIVALLTVLSLGIAIPGEAGVFWMDDFENDLTPNWDTSACGSPAPKDGCNGFISADRATSGTHSLQSHYPDITQQAGTYYDRLHTPTSEIWMRFYYYTVNFQYYPQAATKHFYNLSSASTKTGSELIWVNMFGSRETAVGAISWPTLNCPNGTTDPNCTYYPNMAHVPLADNQWYCIEYHAKTNTPGQSDALLEIYVDGVQTLGYYNLVLQTDTTQWDLVRHYTQYGQGDRYIDDLAVGNTRIGCRGSASAIPTVPSGLSLQ